MSESSDALRSLVGETKNCFPRKFEGLLIHTAVWCTWIVKIELTPLPVSVCGHLHKSPPQLGVHNLSGPSNKMYCVSQHSPFCKSYLLWSHDLCYYFDIFVGKFYLAEVCQSTRRGFIPPWLNLIIFIWTEALYRLKKMTMNTKFCFARHQLSRNNRVNMSLWEMEILQLIISEGSNIFDLQCTGRMHQSSLAKKCFCLMPSWKLVSSWLYVMTSDGIWASKPLIHQRWMLLVSII